MINCTLITTNDKTFSYKLYKNPASSPFEHRAGVTSFFIGDQIYNISIEKGSLLDIEDLQSLQTWNVKHLFSHSPTTITTVFNEVLRSATRKRAEDAEYDSWCYYEMVFAPIMLRNDEMLELANLCDIHYAFDAERYTVTFSSGKTPLDQFLQKVFVCLFVGFEAYDHSNKEQIQMLAKFVVGWNNPDEAKILQLVTGRRKTFATQLENAGMEVEQRDITLHEWKHNKIAEILKNPDGEFSDKSFVELGCGTGQFAVALKPNKAKYIGVDTNDFALNKAIRKMRSLKFINSDMNRLGRAVIDKMEVVLLLEVIEHLEEDDLTTLVMNLDYVYRPEYIVITTPNVEANALYGFEGFRHKDHKFEFNSEQYNEFLGRFTNYQILESVVVDTKEKSGFDIEPSFVTFLIRTGENEFEGYVEAYYKNIEMDLIRYGKSIAPMYLSQIDYLFTSDQLKRGMSSRHYKNTTPFFLGAAIAPADVKDRTEYVFGTSFIAHNGEFCVEHPQYATEYYRNKGYTGEFIFQIKEMGSRANILVFKDLETAQKYGYSQLVTIQSRRGYEFFRNKDDEKKYYELVYASLVNDVSPEFDVIMLDAEITPWSYLAKGIIEQDFREPILLQLNGGLYNNLVKNLAGIEFEPFNPQGCYDFLNSLEVFTKEEDLKCHVFDLLLLIRGKEVIYGYNTHYEVKLNLLDAYLQLNEFISIVQSFDTSKNAWKYAIENKKEGIVIKPKLQFLKNGTLLQPAIKARTPLFLRLIYGGPNYDEYFHFIERRNVKSKRSVAIRESALSNLMIASFAKRDRVTAKKAIAAFHSDETKVDGTL